jgi:hypothetical protein
MPRALRQRSTQNIGMAVEPDEGGKLAYERIQSAFPVRAGKRRKTIKSDGILGLLCSRSPGQCQTAIISPTHKRTEGRAPVWGSEFTSKDAALQGGDPAETAARLNVKLRVLVTAR